LPDAVWFDVLALGKAGYLMTIREHGTENAAQQSDTSLVEQVKPASKRNTALEEALSWTYQAGYVHGLKAARAYAELAGCAFRIHDGGTFADWLTFFDDEAAAVAAEGASRFTYRRPEVA
jgi:hypothetical protein